MKDRPILFNAEMVRAVLDGRKSQTRRVIKPQPPPNHGYHCGPAPGGINPPRCPYGVPGDRLWVRETWALGGDYANAKARRVPTSERSPEFIRYRASQEKGPHTGRWRPSIHMPRWASRITLEVVAIRVERVQDTSYADIWAEGGPASDSDIVLSAWWRHLWDSINAKRGYGWDVNPWVWVVEFKVIA